MDNGMDLAHVNKKIQSNTSNLDQARRNAENQRMMAGQRHQEGNPDGALYYEREAERLEQEADKLEDENDYLLTEKERLERRIAELEQRRATISSEHTEQLARISDELNRIRGSSLML